MSYYSDWMMASQQSSNQNNNMIPSGGGGGGGGGGMGAGGGGMAMDIIKLANDVNQTNFNIGNQFAQLYQSRKIREENERNNALNRVLAQKKFNLDRLLGMQQYNANEDQLRKNREVARYLSTGKV